MLRLSKYGKNVNIPSNKMHIKTLKGGSRITNLKKTFFMADGGSYFLKLFILCAFCY
jgi:hypothetical protein